MVRLFTYIAMSVAALIMGVSAIAIVVLWRISTEIPGYDHLANYEPKVMSRFYSEDGLLLAEYAWERRLFVPYEGIPPRLTDAFLSAEDRKFFEHGGLNVGSIMRSAVANVGRALRGQRPLGGSTITQQVARNFLLTQELRLKRKIKEALLALRLEKALSKTRILELYLNQIFMGLGSYGVASASLAYFGKSLSELTLPEIAYLAALPKGPNNYHPLRHRERARARRDWVLKRMRVNGYISEEEEREARAQPLPKTLPQNRTLQETGPYFVEEARRRITKLYGGKAIYGGGLSVRTTLSPRFQSLAEKSLREGLIAYDRRHGWRGPVGRLEAGLFWPIALQNMTPLPGLEPWTLAVVTNITPDYAEIGIKPSRQITGKDAEFFKLETGVIPLEELKWAREHLEDGKRGAKISRPADVLSVGDIIYAERQGFYEPKPPEPSEDPAPLAERPLHDQPSLPPPLHDRPPLPKDWQKPIAELKKPILRGWTPPVLMETTPDFAEMGIIRADSPAATETIPLSSRKGFVPLQRIAWERQSSIEGEIDLIITRPDPPLSAGEVLYAAREDSYEYLPPRSFSPLAESLARAASDLSVYARNADAPPLLPSYALRQVPRANGALVALDPHDGRVLALTGGFSYAISEFNRATQARRQPGSAFKPFIYAVALESGFTPASRILDAPFVTEREASGLLWKPENYGKSFHGLSTLRTGLEKSRNLMTLHLANALGVERIVDYAKRFGLAKGVRAELGIALGIEETTLLDLTAAYAAFPNGGRRVKPFLIERIQDRRGRAVFKRDRRQCWKCAAPQWEEQKEPEFLETRDQIISPQTAYQLISLMEGVVSRGTGRTARLKGRPIAGKTGTTDEEHDAWFVGFSPNLVVGVFVGFDAPETLGNKETGGRVAAPIFALFMKEAIGDRPPQPFAVPPGVSLVRINAKTGFLPASEKERTILEAFKTGTQPDPNSEKLAETIAPQEGEEEPAQSLLPASEKDKDESYVPGTGGLY